MRCGCSRRHQQRSHDVDTQNTSERETEREIEREIETERERAASASRIVTIFKLNAKIRLRLSAVM